MDIPQVYQLASFFEPAALRSPSQPGPRLLDPTRWPSFSSASLGGRDRCDRSPDLTRQPLAEAAGHWHGSLENESKNAEFDRRVCCAFITQHFRRINRLENRQCQFFKERKSCRRYR